MRGRATRLADALGRYRRTIPVRRATLEAILIASVYVAYSIVRGLVDGRDTEAIARGIEVVAFEQSAGIFIERQIQSALLQFPAILSVLNVMYSSAHLPPLILLAAWSFHSSRRKYSRLRTSFLLSSAMALALYWLLPTAPPRLLPPDFGFVDTVSQYGPLNVYSPGSTGRFVNDFAAIPSLHFAWATLVGFGLAWVVDWRWYGKVVAVGWPMTILIVIVGTANHFLLDAILGMAVMAVAFLLATLLHTAAERGLPGVCVRAHD